MLHIGSVNYVPLHIKRHPQSDWWVGRFIVMRGFDSAKAEGWAEKKGKASEDKPNEDRAGQGPRTNI